MTIDDKRYWDQEFASRDAEMADAARPRSLSERLNAAIKRSNLIRDGYGYEAERAAARAEVDELRAQVQTEDAARFEAEWTREITIERRAAWNAALRDPQYRARNAAKSVLVGKVQSDLGFTMDALKTAVARWAL
ncbi:MAG TPA: hypothetical protein VM013_09600 [Dehalococcoidia bacterium]|nr:hypothetical protein [Dehalococcoidia bacterium]